MALSAGCKREDRPTLRDITMREAPSTSDLRSNDLPEFDVNTAMEHVYKDIDEAKEVALTATETKNMSNEDIPSMFGPCQVID